MIRLSCTDGKNSILHKTFNVYVLMKRYTSKVSQLAMERGCIVYTSSGMEQGVEGDALMIAPPYIITESEIDTALDILDDAIGEFEKELG